MMTGSEIIESHTQLAGDKVRDTHYNQGPELDASGNPIWDSALADDSGQGVEQRAPDYWQSNWVLNLEPLWDGVPQEGMRRRDIQDDADAIGTVREAYLSHLGDIRADLPAGPGIAHGPSNTSLQRQKCPSIISSTPLKGAGV